MKNKILAILVFGVLFLTGCLTDKTNLDYKNVILPDSVIVTDISTQQKLSYKENGIYYYYVISGNELQLDVDVRYKGDDELAFEWQFDGKVISREKNLRYVCIKSGLIHLLIYRKNADNAMVYQMEISIRTPFSSGIAVIGKDNGRSQMDFVESRGGYEAVELEGVVNERFYRIKYVPHQDIYPLYNDGEELGENPFKMVLTRGYNENASYKVLQILDRNWQNSVALNSADMKKVVSMKDEFVLEPENLQPENFVSVGAMSLLLDKSGKVYTRVNYDNGTPNTGRFITEPLVYNDPYDVPDKGPEEVKASDIISLDQLAVIYEKENKRFLAFTASTGQYQGIEYSMFHSLSTPTNNLPDGYVDLNNFDKELVTFLFHASVFNKYVYFIYKDGNDYFIQTATINPTLYYSTHKITYTAVSNVKLPSDVAQLIKESKGKIKIGMNRSYRDVMYIGTDKALYSASMSGTSLEKIYEFEDSGNIKDFVITSTWRSEGFSALDRYFNGRVFGVSFDNGDFKVIKLYVDPRKPGEEQVEYYYDRHYDRGVSAIYYY